MKKIISLLAFLFSTSICLNAQSVTLLNCIDEGNFEVLKIKENLDENNYLLFYQSALAYDSISMSGNLHYWFNKINGNGSSIWKKEIPNSDKGRYVFTLYGWTPISFLITDFSYKIYSKVDNELILHYNYFDSVSTDTSRYAMHHGNNILDFGIINSTDGNYKVPIFTIDTLVYTSLVPIYIDPDDPNPQIPKDTIVHISNPLVKKINDSIYQMAVQYSKYINYYRSYAFTNFYNINVNSKQVIKKQYDQNIDNILSVNNRFYAFSYFTNLFRKVNLFGIDETTYSVPESLFYLNYPNSRQLKFLSNTEPVNYRTHALLISVDTTTLATSSIAYNNYIQDTSFFSASESLIPIDYLSYSNIMFGNSTYFDFGSYKKYNNKRFLIHTYQYYDSTNTYGGKNLIAKLNLDNGNIETERELKAFNAPLYPTYISEPFRDDIFPNNDVLVPFDSVTSTIYGLDTALYTSFFSTHRFSLSRLDSNLNERWTTVFPDSVMQDSITYYCGIRSLSGDNANALIYYPIDYKNQFIVGINYGTKADTIFSNYTPQITKYFFVNNNTGEIKDMNLPLFLSQSRLTFFNSPTNDLSIITPVDLCSGNYLDIGIYKYNDIINNVKPKSTNTFDFSVFPNPANVQVNIVLNDALRNKEINMRIIDISGKIVFANTFKNIYNYNIDVSKFSSGMYFIQLQTDDLQLTKKIQIVH